MHGFLGPSWVDTSAARVSRGLPEKEKEERLAPTESEAQLELPCRIRVNFLFYCIVQLLLVRRMKPSSNRLAFQFLITPAPRNRFDSAAERHVSRLACMKTGKPNTRHLTSAFTPFGQNRFASTTQLDFRQ